MQKAEQISMSTGEISFAKKTSHRTCHQSLYFEHPNVILRVAGLPLSLVGELTDQSPLHLLNEISERSAKASRLSEQACEGLHQSIGSSKFEARARRTLLRGRRNIFGRRQSGLQAHEDVFDQLAPDLKAAIVSFDQETNEIGQLETAYVKAYILSQSASRDIVPQLCQKNQDFLKAVALSSSSLAADFMATDQHARRRAKNLGVSLFNYLIRAATKVSPFSFFTPVCTAHWDSKVEPGFTLESSSVHSHVEVSRRALLHLLAALTKQLAFWGEATPLELNPTFRMDGNAVSFCRIWEPGRPGVRTWGVYQTPLRLPLTPRLLAMIHFYSSRAGKAYSLRELYELLGGQEPFDFEFATFSTYVAQAVRADLLIPKIDLVEQEDLLVELSSLLASKQHVASCFLSELAQEVQQYHAHTYTPRVCSAIRVKHLFTELYKHSGATQLETVKAPIFYEDCYIKQSRTAIAPETLGTTLADLHRFSEFLPFLDSNHVIQSIMASLFRRTFGSAAVKPASEVAAVIADKAYSVAMNLTDLSLSDQEQVLAQMSDTACKLLGGKRLMLEGINRLLRKGESIVIGEGVLGRLERLLPAAVLARPTSYTVIGQTDDACASRRFVLNRIYSGHSMLMSRFLQGESNSSVDRVRSYLDKVNENRRTVEIPGVFGFNANLHPCLAGAELDLEGRQANYRHTEKISLDELEVSYDERVDRLRFSSRSGEELSLNYFGLLNLMSLPRIYQFFGRAHVQGLIFDLWQELYFAGLITPDEPAVLPRVTFRNVVLSRRSIFVPAERLPSASLGEIEFFRAYHNLLASLNFQQSHFARLVATREDFVGTADEPAGSMGSTDFKPAFVGLEMPLTLTALKRRLQRRQRSLLLQEVLPDWDDGGIKWNGNRHACEWQFEISRLGPHPC